MRVVPENKLGTKDAMPIQNKVDESCLNRAGNVGSNKPSLVPNGDMPLKESSHRLTVEDILSVIQVEPTRSQLEALRNLLDSVQRHEGGEDMHMTLEPSLWQQVSVLQRKIRNGLSAANTIAVTVEKNGSNLFVLCHYYERRFDTQCVCVDVIPRSEMLGTTETGDIINMDEDDKFDNSQNCEMLGKLFQRIANNLSYWKIRNKVVGVVVTGRGVGCGRWRFLPEALTGNESEKIGEGSSQCTWRRTGNEVVENGASRDNSGLGVGNDARIGVVPCLVDTLERIVTESICQHEIFEKKFIVPLSELMFKALLDRNYFQHGKTKEWTSQIELPIRDITLRSMVFIFGYVCENMSEIKKAVQNSTNNGGDEILDKIKLEEVKVVREVLEAFSSAVTAIRIDDSSRECQRSWRCERSSAGLPIMCTLHERLEKLLEQIPDPMQYLVGLALHVVDNEWREMEKTETHGCATLLDPRFKTEYFSSKEAVSNVVNIVVDLCDAERRKKRLSRSTERRGGDETTRQVSGSESGLTDSASGGLASWDNMDGHGGDSGNGGNSSTDDARRGGNKGSMSGGTNENFDKGGGCVQKRGEFDDLMDAIAPSQRVSAADVISYLGEGKAELSQNVEEYWERNQLRWPLLTSVATRYSLIPCCCFGLERATGGSGTELRSGTSAGTDNNKVIGAGGARALLKGLSNTATGVACEDVPSGNAHGGVSAAAITDGQRVVTKSGEELGREFLRSNLIIAENQLR